jgi:hypothetical protein
LLLANNESYGCIKKDKTLACELVESIDLGFEILHPGGMDNTQELADTYGIEQDTFVLDVASGTCESAYYPVIYRARSLSYQFLLEEYD